MSSVFRATSYDTVDARMTREQKIAHAWHDVTCPQAEECPSRELHSRSAPLVNSGVLERFLLKINT